MKKLIIIVLAAITFSSVTIYGQQQNRIIPNKIVANTNQIMLYNEIYKQDSIFFNAFNNCDTITYRRFLSDNFEFYHDLGGLHYLDEEMQSMREMCKRNSHIRRQLIKNTLEVYKLGDYGALEIGVHNFYHTNSGQSEHLSGTYKFIQVWQKTKNDWKLSRVISYSHDKINNN